MASLTITTHIWTAQGMDLLNTIPLICDYNNLTYTPRQFNGCDEVWTLIGDKANIIHALWDLYGDTHYVKFPEAKINKLVTQIID